MTARCIRHPFAWSLRRFWCAPVSRHQDGIRHCAERRLFRQPVAKLNCTFSQLCSRTGQDKCTDDHIVRENELPVAGGPVPRNSIVTFGCKATDIPRSEATWW